MKQIAKHAVRQKASGHTHTVDIRTTTQCQQLARIIVTTVNVIHACDYQLLSNFCGGNCCTAQKI